MEVNKKQLADIFGASIRTIQNWQEQGMPVLRGGGKGNEVLYDSAAVIRWYAERDAEIENEKLRREVEELRQASETDLQPGTIEYERHRLTRAQADAQELKNARDSAEVVETAFCTFVLSRIAGEIASILDGIAMVNPANGNTKPMFVGQGDQIFMNEVFLKYLTAPTITSGGNPPAFSLTPDGKLTAKNADISGSVNANSGTLNNVTINENCQIKGKLSANQIEGDIVKTVSKSFPRTNSYASGTITVRISDDQKFDRQVMIPPVLFRGGKHENFNSNNQQSYWYSTCRLRVTRNGQEIFNQSTTDAQGVFSSVIDMPAGQGTLTLTFTVSSSGANNWTPTTSISDLLVVVMKKSTAGISIS
ncbi:host specificity protein [Escherichia coli]|nr:host specificity protein [Escherichia coli]